jgi:hypothetical protein
MTDPPVVTGATHASAAPPFAGVTASDVGAFGVRLGLTDALEVVAPTPAAFSPATRNVYEDPFVNPVTTYVVRGFAVVATVLHVVPSVVTSIA